MANIPGSPYVLPGGDYPLEWSIRDRLKKFLAESEEKFKEGLVFYMKRGSREVKVLLKIVVKENFPQYEFLLEKYEILL